MKYTGKAYITSVDYALPLEAHPIFDDMIGRITESPVIVLKLADLKDESPDSINEKLAALASGGRRVTITIERED